MQIKKRVGKSFSNMVNWIFSYIIVLIIPIVISSVCSLYTNSVLSKEKMSSNTVALQIIVSELETAFEQLINLEYNVYFSEKIKAVEIIEQPLDSVKRTQLLEGSKSFDNCIDKDAKIISSARLYFPRNEMLISSGKTYVYLESNYENLGKAFGYTYEEWKALLERRYDRKFLVNSETGEVLYITTIPRYGKTVKKNMVLGLNTAYMQEILAKLDNMKGAILLVSDSGEVLSSRNIDGIRMDLLSEEIFESDNYIRTSINGENMMIACCQLENVDLKLISIISYKEFWEVALKSFALFWFAMVLSIVVGVMVSGAFSMKKQSVWGALSSIIEKKMEKKHKNIITRDRVIGKVISDIAAEYHSMQTQLASVDDMKREVLLTAILRGRIHAEEVEQVLQKNGVEVKLGNYAVVLFRLDGFELLGNAEVQKVSEEVITSIVQDFEDKGFCCDILKLNEKIVCIVDFGSIDKEECYHQIEEFLRDTYEKIMQSGKDSLSISISDVHKHISSLMNAYTEVLRVMEYQMNVGGEPIMGYFEMIQSTNNKYLYSVEEEKNLLQLISLGKEKEALAYFEERYDKNIDSIYGSEELIRCFIWNITASVLRAEGMFSDQMNLPDMREFLETVNETNSVLETKQLLAKRIKEICGGIAQIKEKKGNIAEQIKEYIHTHYTDTNLDNTEIADYFHIKAPYLSTLFKERTGENVQFYIQTVRMNKAKELLETTDLNVEEIGQRVGCNNKVSFIRLFKKFEKITPTEYRKKCKESKSL
ncbi:MAG: helix-turn-helix domain-containing protein [Lachnospiraceae bacterium]|nr:helix-turn-helix domain-containing protein [Lachnospiraceae bacterium]